MAPPHAEKAYQVLTTISKAATMATMLITAEELGIDVVLKLLGHPIIDRLTALVHATILMGGGVVLAGNAALDDQVEESESRE